MKVQVRHAGMYAATDCVNSKGKQKTGYTEQCSYHSNDIQLHHEFLAVTLPQGTVGVATPTVGQMRGDAFVDDANDFNPLPIYLHDAYNLLVTANDPSPYAARKRSIDRLCTAAEVKMHEALEMQVAVQEKFVGLLENLAVVHNIIKYSGSYIHFLNCCTGDVLFRYLVFIKIVYKSFPTLVSYSFKWFYKMLAVVIRFVIVKRISCKSQCSETADKSYYGVEVVGVENDLEVAKKAYLQATIGISTTKKMAAIPKLFAWYMLDFAKDLDMLLDWVCIQLPHEVVKETMNCLERNKNVPLSHCIRVHVLTSNMEVKLILCSTRDLVMISSLYTSYWPYALLIRTSRISATPDQTILRLLAI
ncbi:hypothetical protein CTI12_AA468170 [Artemisia annua]|uniref:Uncharacterized protein n=1 Tax=Artemisia annua TaxID=35608 RepID=A0A2U1LPX3_ARTAN|nr:hypothetical protein CTI12_AA468170 [Artemisia annua]